MIAYGAFLLEFWLNTKPLFLFIIGIAVYAMFIFKFYRFLASRDIFEMQIAKNKDAGFGKKMWWLLSHAIKNVIVFPLCVFFWFIVLTFLLAFLARNQDIENILLVAMAVVGAVRVTAYYNEDLSKDLAKMLPFALLGVYLVDISFFALDTSLALVKQIPKHGYTLILYLVFIICLEIILSTVYALYVWIKKEK